MEWPWHGEAGTLDWSSDYPLHHACEEGDEQTAQSLLESGADVNELEPQRLWSPLQYAAGSGHLGACQLLIAAGASLLEEPPGDPPCTPLLLALNSGCWPLSRLLLTELRSRGQLVHAGRALFVQPAVGGPAADAPVVSPPVARATSLKPPPAAADGAAVPPLSATLAPSRYRSSPADAPDEESRHSGGRSVIVGPGYCITGGLAHACLLTSAVRTARDGVCVVNGLCLKRPPAKVYAQLLGGAHRLLESDNLGGTSELSEALSFELIARCFGPPHARLHATEREVQYFDSRGARTDYVAELFAAPCAVSVTRAYETIGGGVEGVAGTDGAGDGRGGGRGGDGGGRGGAGSAKPFELADAERLLRKKLAGVQATNRSNAEGWRVQLLHCWAQSARVARLVRLAHALLPRELRANTVVLVTVVQRDRYGLDHVIFGNEGLADGGVRRDRVPPYTPEVWRRQQQASWRAMLPLGAARRPNPRLERLGLSDLAVARTPRNVKTT